MCDSDVSGSRRNLAQDEVRWDVGTHEIARRDDIEDEDGACMLTTEDPNRLKWNIRMCWSSLSCNPEILYIVLPPHSHGLSTNPTM
jgi:hypothetical protein